MSESRSVLVIDDESERLEPLVSALEAALGAGVAVRPWQPTHGEDPLERFDTEVKSGLSLIVTDQDLTKSGLGLLGSSITSWAQDAFIPVCNFSRKPIRRLPRERNFFELRVPPEHDETARAAYIARVYRGFEHIRSYVSATNHGHPTAQVLAGAMGAPEIEDDVAPFLASVASANSSFMQSVVLGNGLSSEFDRVSFLSFILGHVLLNAVLEFPGPILSLPALAAYCAVSEVMADDLARMFANAAYTGPFSADGAFFQRQLVDQHIDSLSAGISDEPDEPDEYARLVVERQIGTVQPHGCRRCAGVRGGYWCPFTRRAVCDRADCSVVSNTWIPRGATLCRVEQNYFEELAPLLGD